MKKTFKHEDLAVILGCLIHKKGQIVPKTALETDAERYKDKQKKYKQSYFFYYFNIFVKFRE